MNKTKQVIVVRKDLGMRQGKVAAQAAHASMSFLTQGMFITYGMGGVIHKEIYPYEFASEVDSWLRNSFRKIVVYVNSEEELDQIHEKALAEGLVSHLIIDSGATEFNGVKTKTVVAIGPHFDEKFKNITDTLPLL